jgi:hypothetical protein
VEADTRAAAGAEASLAIRVSVATGAYCWVRLMAWAKAFLRGAR